MANEDYPTVQVGDEQVRLRPFGGRKALLAGKMVRRLSKSWPLVVQEQAEFERAYGEQVQTRITRDMGLMRPEWRDQLAHISEEEWQAMGGVLTIPAEPDAREMDLVAFGAAFEHMEEEVVKLLGLVVASDSKVVEKAKAGEAEEFLLEEGYGVVDRSEFGELIELLAAAAELVQDELSRRADPLRKLRRIVGQETAPPVESTAEELPIETTEQKPEPEGEPTDAIASEPERSSESEKTEQPDANLTGISSTSSTSSPSDTDGDQTSPSTARSGSAISSG